MCRIALGEAGDLGETARGSGGGSSASEPIEDMVFTVHVRLGR